MGLIPQVFNWIQIRFESRAWHVSDVVLTEEVQVQDNPSRVGGSIVLLKHVDIVTRLKGIT